MIVDNLSQLLGTKNNKYERNKLLEQWGERNTQLQKLLKIIQNIL